MLLHLQQPHPTELNQTLSVHMTDTTLQSHFTKRKKTHGQHEQTAWD